jgi:hypothetical protein
MMPVVAPAQQPVSMTGMNFWVITLCGERSESLACLEVPCQSG